MHKSEGGTKEYEKGRLRIFTPWCYVLRCRSNYFSGAISYGEVCALCIAVENVAVEVERLIFTKHRNALVTASDGIIVILENEVGG